MLVPIAPASLPLQPVAAVIAPQWIVPYNYLEFAAVVLVTVSHSMALLQIPCNF